MISDRKFEQRIGAVVDAAKDWSDPEYPRRAEAVDTTLEADNSFTEEAVAFAVNQQMSLLTADDLRSWIGDRRAEREMEVGVLNAGNVPLVGLQDFLAVVLTGHRYRGSTSSKSPELLPAFVADLASRCQDLEASFLDVHELLERVEALMATGSDDTVGWIHEQADVYGIPRERRLVRGHRFAVAVLGGDESEEDYERLAEDALLHEGLGCRNVAVVWAPRGTSPDALLDALARFRAVFPAHESTPRRLKMQQAFLEAVDAPHAYGEGLEFLVSKGEPEAQQPGHIRWTEYTEPAEILRWLRQNADRVQLVVAGDGVARRVTEDDREAENDRTDGRRALPIRSEHLGQAQRPSLSWRPDGVDVVAFLARLK